MQNPLSSQGRTGRGPESAKGPALAFSLLGKEVWWQQQGKCSSRPCPSSRSPKGYAGLTAAGPRSLEWAHTGPTSIKLLRSLDAAGSGITHESWSRAVSRTPQMKCNTSRSCNSKLPGIYVRKEHVKLNGIVHTVGSTAGGFQETSATSRISRCLHPSHKWGSLCV